jgi:CheY-like chemotaxis protein
MFKYRILVVEDNALNLKLVRDILQLVGHDVLEARSGEEGVEMARRCAPHLVLMDLQLPGIDGVEALRVLRSDDRTAAIPVVAVTAFAMKADRERVGREGFDGYLAKPISIRDLPTQVNQFLSRPSDD